MKLEEKYDSAGFEETFPNIVRTAKRIEEFLRNRKRHVIVEKPVKAGARRLIEALAERNKEFGDAKIKHVYVTKLDRTDINNQIDEMKAYGIECYKIKKTSDVDAVIYYIQTQLKNNKIIWIHLDEGDYGTAEDQLLAPLFRMFVSHNKDKSAFEVFFIDYSASNEEAILSDFNDEDLTALVELEPGPDYKGAGWFLDNDLVKQAEAFWDFTGGIITEQGQECIDKLDNDIKLFGVVRLMGTDFKEAQLENGAFLKFFKSQNIQVVFVDKLKRFDWGNSYQGGEKWKAYLYEKAKVLIVVNQTCTRSTEVGFHKNIAFWHDLRNKSTPYNTRIQAYGRIFHYLQQGHSISIYADIKTFELAAKYISYNEYPQKMSSRVKALNKSIKDRVLIDINLFKNYNVPCLKGVRTLTKENGNDRSILKQFMDKNVKDRGDIEKFKNMPIGCSDESFISVSGFCFLNLFKSIDNEIPQSLARSCLRNYSDFAHRRIGFYLNSPPNKEDMLHYLNDTRSTEQQFHFKKDLKLAGVLLNDTNEIKAEKLHKLYKADFDKCSVNGEYKYVVFGIKRFVFIDGPSSSNKSDYEDFLSSELDYFIIETKEQVEDFFSKDKIHETCLKTKLLGREIVGNYYSTVVETGEESVHETNGSMYNSIV